MLLVIAFSVPLMAHADEVYMIITGDSQGLFEGDPFLPAPHTGKVQLKEYGHGLVKPLPESGGELPGAKSHRQVRITKDVDEYTHELLAAWVNYEPLTVTIEFWSPHPSNGTDLLSYTVTLNNAYILSMLQNRAWSEDQQLAPLQEIVSFSYASIRLSNFGESQDILQIWVP